MVPTGLEGGEIHGLAVARQRNKYESFFHVILAQLLICNVIMDSLRWRKRF